MNATSYVLVQTLDRNVLHNAATLLNHVQSIHVYTTKAGWQFHIGVDNGLVLIMPKAVYGYFINGEHVPLPNVSSLRPEGLLPEELKNVAEATNDQWKNNNTYYTFEEEQDD